MKIITSDKFVELTMLNQINSGASPTLNSIDEPTLITDLSLLKNKETTLILLGKLLVEQDVEIMLIPNSKAHTTEADFLEQQLCYLEGVGNDEELSENRVNTAFVELIKDRSLQLISSSQTPKETQKNLVLNYVKVCYFGENSMVQSYFTKSEGLNMLRQHELLFDFLTFIESEYPDIEPSWKNELVCRYYNRKVSEESFD